MVRSELKTNAKRVISGKVFYSFLVVFIYGVITGIPSLLMTGKNSGFYAFGGLLSIVVAILLIPMMNGVYLYFHKLSTEGNGEISDLFVPYKNGAMKELIIAKIISGIYIFLGALLFIIPGIILALKYSMIDYIFVENPKISHQEAMQTSADLMKGKKLDLFVLGLSFIGWFLLSALTLGILLIYVIPYSYATFMQFYYSIRRIEEIPSGENSNANPIA